jgi:ABC-type uncharacterized transport system permease subunit
MTSTVASLVAAALYLMAGGMQWYRLLRGPAAPTLRAPFLVVAFGGVLTHALLLQATVPIAGGLNLPFTQAASLVACTISILYVIAAISRPAEYLGLLVLPVSALTVILAWAWPGQAVIPTASGLQAAHIVISILAYALLALATVQSLLLFYQERALRSRQPVGLMRALPPLQTMETLMFRMLGIGFLLLTLTLLTGIVFSEEIFGRALPFTHHVVLSLIAWILFGTLLFGRWRYGWRGRTAVGWTVAGYMLLLLGYFGSKFVLEVLLKRPV